MVGFMSTLQKGARDGWGEQECSISHKDKDKVTAVHGAESSPYLAPGPAAPSSDFQHCDKFSLLLCFAL